MDSDSYASSNSLDEDYTTPEEDITEDQNVDGNSLAANTETNTNITIKAVRFDAPNGTQTTINENSTPSVQNKTEAIKVTNSLLHFFIFNVILIFLGSRQCSF
jgi:predicted Abi (CAAX) family protease